MTARLISLVAVLPLLAASGRARALEPETSPLHFVLVLGAGGTQLVAPQFQGWIGEAQEVGMGFGFGLSRLLSLQILADARLDGAFVDASFGEVPVGRRGPELLLDLPVDLRLRLGTYWVIYGGGSPWFSPCRCGYSGGVFWRGGIERFFDYRADALGLLVEGNLAGGLGALLTLTFHGGDNFEPIR